MLDSTHIRTTVYIPRKLHEDAKLMALFTHSNISRLVCEGLREKINNLTEIKKEKK